MLLRRALQALKALLELARSPEEWQSVTRLAAAQQLPAPMLEQLLLQLRRADLVEARRGRSGGYRLRRPPSAIPVAAILKAVDANLEASLAMPPKQDDPSAGDRVLLALEQRLQRALERELVHLTLEELLFDLRSWQERLREDGGLMVG